MSWPTRGGACVGLGIWLVLGGRVALWARDLLSFRAGPNDIAAHGMVPADLQIHVIGIVGSRFALALLAPALVLFAFVALGRRWALYAACPVALTIGWYAWQWHVLLGTPAAWLWSGGAFVLGTAVAEPILQRLVRLRDFAGSLLPQLWPVAFLHLGVWAFVAHMKAEKRAAEEQVAVAEAARARQLAKRLAEEGARPAPAPTPLPSPPMIFEESAATSHPESPVVSLSFDMRGATAVALHRDGLIEQWSQMGGMLQGGPGGRSWHALTSVPGATRAYGWDAFTLIQSGSKLRALGRGQDLAISHCANGEQHVLVEPLPRMQLLIAGRSLCHVELSGVKATTLPVPGCARVNGLQMAAGGDEALVQCDGLVSVFEIKTWKRIYAVRTPLLVPGSARLLGGAYMGVERVGARYSAVFGALDVARDSKLKRLPLYASKRAPQLEALGPGAFVAAGAGVCTYRAPSYEQHCELPTNVPVIELAVPGALRSFAYTRNAEGRVVIGPQAMLAAHDAQSLSLRGLAVVDRIDDPVVAVNLR